MATGKIGERALLQHELIGCGLAEAMTKIEAARWLTYEGTSEIQKLTVLKYLLRKF